MKIQLQPYYFQIAVKEVKAIEENGKKSVLIQGFASTPDLDRYKDIVLPEAFSGALPMFMKNPTLLRSHEPDCPAGNITQVKVTNQGLWIEALVTEERTVEDVLENRMRALSIGYIPLESTLQHEDGSAYNAEVDSPWDADMVRVIKKLDLVEISIVSTPANGNALFSIANSVKQYFNQLVTKSMLIKKNADEVIETPEEKEQREAEEAAAKIKAEENKTETEKTPEEIAAEAQTKLDEEAAKNKIEGEEPKEEIEKGAEIAPADGGEDVKVEEPNAEIKPEEKPEEVIPAAAEAIGVDSESAKSLPELVQAGLLKESKDAGAITLPKSIVSLFGKLVKSYGEAITKVNELEAKLEKIPEKRALAVHGQFKEEDGKEVSVTKKASSEFMSLFSKAK
jgi:HK97 family phage prohead protease